MYFPNCNLSLYFPHRHWGPIFNSLWKVKMCVWLSTSSQNSADAIAQLANNSNASVLGLQGTKLEMSGHLRDPPTDPPDPLDPSDPPWPGPPGLPDPPGPPTPPGLFQRLFTHCIKKHPFWFPLRYPSETSIQPTSAQVLSPLKAFLTHIPFRIPPELLVTYLGAQPDLKDIMKGCSSSENWTGLTFLHHVS